MRYLSLSCSITALERPVENGASKQAFFLAPLGRFSCDACNDDIYVVFFTTFQHFRGYSAGRFVGKPQLCLSSVNIIVQPIILRCLPFPALSKQYEILWKLLLENQATIGSLASNNIHSAIEIFSIFSDS